MSWTVEVRGRIQIVCHDPDDAETQRAELAAMWGKGRVKVRPDDAARAEAQRAMGGGRHG